jgi:DNA-directed RNA polymerase specialized sigma24 family protein
LDAVRDNLARSARRIASKRAEKSRPLPQTRVLDGQTSKSDLERALLAIDAFPRAAVLLVLFERVPLGDAAILLNAEPNLVRKAVAVGARDLTINLAGIEGWKSTLNGANTTIRGQHAKTTGIPS